MPKVSHQPAIPVRSLHASFSVYHTGDKMYTSQPSACNTRYMGHSLCTTLVIRYTLVSHQPAIPVTWVILCALLCDKMYTSRPSACNTRYMGHSLCTTLVIRYTLVSHQPAIPVTWVILCALLCDKMYTSRPPACNTRYMVILCVPRW